MNLEQHLENIEHFTRLHESTKDVRFKVAADNAKQAIRRIIDEQQAVINRIQNKINELEAQQDQQMKLF